MQIMTSHTTSPVLIRFTWSLLLLLSLAAGSVSANTVRIHSNEQTGLKTWTVEDNGFQIELIQLLPDFVRAIYSKHDFPPEEVERVAAFCVFGTILKNTSDTVMSYKVADWTYRYQAGSNERVTELPVKTKTQWLQEWRRQGIVFSWTLLPDEGEFAVGDWQQGFTTVKLPRDTRFDLVYRWKLDGKAHEGVIKGLECAPESL